MGGSVKSRRAVDKLFKSVGYAVSRSLVALRRPGPRSVKLRNELEVLLKWSRVRRGDLQHALGAWMLGATHLARSWHTNWHTR